MFCAFGCPCRDMHERYGKWNSVYVCFRRWAERGVWDALLEPLVELELTDNWQHMIDSTTVRGHSQAAGAKGGLIKRVLIDHAAALRQNSMPARPVRDVLSALSWRAARHLIIAPFPRFSPYPLANLNHSLLTRYSAAIRMRRGRQSG